LASFGVFGGSFLFATGGRQNGRVKKSSQNAMNFAYSIADSTDSGAHAPRVPVSAPSLKRTLFLYSLGAAFLRIIAGFAHQMGLEIVDSSL
jgi:hypothetical protein